MESKDRSQSDTRNSEKIRMDSEGGKRKDEVDLYRPGGGLRIGR
jgi:hypothetical protein